MGRFNLVDEPWVRVMTDSKGTTESVSLRDIFANGHKYVSLAGEMETQDFAILRFLLAVNHTVLSRYMPNGEPYSQLNINEKMQQTEQVDELLKDEYIEALQNTWLDIWDEGRFPEVIIRYLECWHDRFYLFDDKYPFYQITEDEILKKPINNKDISVVAGKMLDRTITESGNNFSIFSPKYQAYGNNSILTEEQLIRWLICYQNYAGQYDKSFFLGVEKNPTKGWAYDLGGIFLLGKNLFETIHINTVVYRSVQKQYNGKKQNPCWENKPSDMMRYHSQLPSPDNLAELYTNWIRVVLIDPDQNMSEPFVMRLVNVPGIESQNNFLEPMTIWRFVEGKNKDYFIPKEHQHNQSLWRSFGLLMMPNNQNVQQKPGILEWFQYLPDDCQPKICAVGMKSDGKSGSQKPANVIHDTLDVGSTVIKDLTKNGWVLRINDTIQDTQNAISKPYRIFLRNIYLLRGMNSKEYTPQIEKELGDMYFRIDSPFRDWLSGIKPNDDKEEKLAQWKKTLSRIILDQAHEKAEHAQYRDYMGKEDGGVIRNIATELNSLSYWLAHELDL